MRKVCWLNQTTDVLWKAFTSSGWPPSIPEEIWAGAPQPANSLYWRIDGLARESIGLTVGLGAPPATLRGTVAGCTGAWARPRIAIGGRSLAGRCKQRQQRLLGDHRPGTALGRPGRSARPMDGPGGPVDQTGPHGLSRARILRVAWAGEPLPASLPASLLERAWRQRRPQNPASDRQTALVDPARAPAAQAPAGSERTAVIGLARPLRGEYARSSGCDAQLRTACPADGYRRHGCLPRPEKPCCRGSGRFRVDPWPGSAWASLASKALPGGQAPIATSARLPGSEQADT